ncbi:MAG: copper transporter [Firmicutes bacterium]|nr:copper transporter [Bacillota bacterium]
MPIDFRYHLTSLVAVFLALALGILLGSNFIAGSSVERQVAKRLEQQFSQLQAENRSQQRTISSLNELMRKSEEFERSVLPALVAGHLAGRRVAIIQAGDYMEAAQSAKSALETAGAEVISVTTISDLSVDSAVTRAARAVELIAGEYNLRDPIQRAIEIIAKCVVNGSQQDAINVLEQKGLIAASGDYNRRVSTVVIVGGSKDKEDKSSSKVIFALIDALKAFNVVAVGCEPYQVGFSSIPTFQKKQIPTVDNVDMPMGQVALVFAITEGKGSFGIKKSAEQILPHYFGTNQWRKGYPR